MFLTGRSFVLSPFWQVPLNTVNFNESGSVVITCFHKNQSNFCEFSCGLFFWEYLVFQLNSSEGLKKAKWWGWSGLTAGGIGSPEEAFLQKIGKSLFFGWVDVSRNYPWPYSYIYDISKLFYKNWFKAFDTNIKWYPAQKNKSNALQRFLKNAPKNCPIL